MRLSELQQTRKDLMIELEQLMKVLKVQGPSNNQASKFSTKISRNQTARQEFQFSSSLGPLAERRKMESNLNDIFSTKLRPFLGLGASASSQQDSLIYGRSPETDSMPASVNSLSEQKYLSNNCKPWDSLRYQQSLRRIFQLKSSQRSKPLQSISILLRVEFLHK